MLLVAFHLALQYNPGSASHRGPVARRAEETQLFRMSKPSHPFDPNTIPRCALPEKSTVTLVVFNTLGERVATLIEGDQRAGNFIEAKKLVVEK
jgi:hypothetical protein